MSDETFNAADETQVKERSKKELRGRDRELADIRAVLSTHHGRRFFWRYLAECGVFRTSFTGNSTTFFNEGKRDIGLRLMADLMEAAPEQYMVMQKESKD